MATIKDWPKNDYSLETSLIFGLPEMLGIMEQKDVWVHIRLNNDIYVPINAIYQYSYCSELEGAEWPTIFYEGTEEIVELKDYSNKMTALFGIIYPIKDTSYLNGKFCITFSGWKNNTLKWYYTEEKVFKIEM